MILKVEALSKVYKNGKGVKGVSFNLEEGEILSILGPNGAGKTTTIKCIVGLRRSDSGTVILNGSFSYLPEEKKLYRWAKVSQMVKITERYVETDEKRAMEILNDLKIPLSEKIANLSHGQLTSLYLALTLSQKADLYILDEPAWGLDPLSRSYVLEKIKEMPFEGKSVLYTSHIVEDVEKTSDRVLIMKDGNVLEDGYIDDMKEKYVAVKTKKGEKMDGYLYKETSDEKIYIVEREKAPPDHEPANFSMIVESIMRGDRR